MVTNTYLKALAFTFVQALLYFDARYPLNGFIYSSYFQMDWYILLLSVYPVQCHAILVLLCIFLSYFHSILLYSHNILLPKTFYSHTCISSLNAYQISSMNFFLSSNPLCLKHYILVRLTVANVYGQVLRVLLLFLLNHSVYNKLLCLLGIIKSSFLYFRA